MNALALTLIPSLTKISLNRFHLVFTDSSMGSYEPAGINTYYVPVSVLYWVVQWTNKLEKVIEVIVINNKRPKATKEEAWKKGRTATALIVLCSMHRFSVMLRKIDEVDREGEIVVCNVMAIIITVLPSIAHISQLVMLEYYSQIRATHKQQMMGFCPSNRCLWH